MVKVTPQMVAEWKQLKKTWQEEGRTHELFPRIAEAYGVSRTTVYRQLTASYKEKARTYGRLYRHLDENLREVCPEDSPFSLVELAFRIRDRTGVLMQPQTILNAAKRYEKLLEISPIEECGSFLYCLNHSYYLKKSTVKG